MRYADALRQKPGELVGRHVEAADLEHRFAAEAHLGVCQRVSAEAPEVAGRDRGQLAALAVFEQGREAQARPGGVAGPASHPGGPRGGQRGRVQLCGNIRHRDRAREADARQDHRGNVAAVISFDQLAIIARNDRTAGAGLGDGLADVGVEEDGGLQREAAREGRDQADGRRAFVFAFLFLEGPGVQGHAAEDNAADIHGRIIIADIHGFARGHRCGNRFINGVGVMRHVELDARHLDPVKQADFAVQLPAVQARDQRVGVGVPDQDFFRREQCGGFLAKQFQAEIGQACRRSGGVLRRKRVGEPRSARERGVQAFDIEV